MPSKTPAQAKLMRAAAHTKGGFGGVPQAVGQDFAAADKKSKSPGPHFAKGPDRKSGNPMSNLGMAMQSARSAKLRGK